MNTRFLQGIIVTVHFTVGKVKERTKSWHEGDENLTLFAGFAQKNLAGQEWVNLHNLAQLNVGDIYSLNVVGMKFFPHLDLKVGLKYLTQDGVLVIVFKNQYFVSDDSKAHLEKIFKSLSRPFGIWKDTKETPHSEKEVGIVLGARQSLYPLH